MSGWVYYKYTNSRGETYEKSLRIQNSRLAKIVENDPATALKIIKMEMPNLKTLHVFSCGAGESPLS